MNMKTISVCPLCGGESIDTDDQMCYDCGEFVAFEIVTVEDGE